MTRSADDWETRGDALAAAAIRAGDPTGWFEQLYAEGVAGTVSMPWDRDAPHPLLAAWADVSQRDATGRTAVVVGCGLGADAELLAGLGYTTTAFDVSPTAVEEARERHPGSRVFYVVADLLHLPAGWARSFDLVVDVFTVQALPDPPRREAIAAVARLVAPGGTLIAVAFRQDPPAREVAGPPWPLTRAEVEAYATDGLVGVRIEEVTDPRDPRKLRWRAEFGLPT